MKLNCIFCGCLISCVQHALSGKLVFCFSISTSMSIPCLSLKYIFPNYFQYCEYAWLSLSHMREHKTTLTYFFGILKIQGCISQHSSFKNWLNYCSLEWQGIITHPYNSPCLRETSLANLTFTTRGLSECRYAYCNRLDPSFKISV